MNSWLKRALVAGLSIVVLFFAAVVVYVNWINDPDPVLDEGDLAEVFARDSEPTTRPAPATAAPDVAADLPAVGEGTSSGNRSLEGRWVVDPSQSTFGYRVEEVLGGVNTTATGRGNEIDGSITIDGTSVQDATFTIQVASITSDQTTRDEQFRGRVMETDEFPTSTFALTHPIELGRGDGGRDGLPAPGEQIVATATGDLTLHGVTREVAFEVTAQTDGSTIGVLGSIPVRFADYDIDNPSNQVVTTEDEGLLEFVLVFDRA